MFLFQVLTQPDSHAVQPISEALENIFIAFLATKENKIEMLIKNIVLYYEIQCLRKAKPCLKTNYHTGR